MARSYSVWVVMGLHAPIATFTVKHELETWLERLVTASKTNTVYRFRDGGSVGCETFVYKRDGSGLCLIA